MLTLTSKFTILFLLLLSTAVFSQNPLLNEYAVKFENPSTVSIVGEDGLIMRTTNNGVNWVEQTTNITNVLYGAAIKEGISLAAGENGVVLRSVDFGNTWDIILPGTLNHFYDIISVIL